MAEKKNRGLGRGLSALMADVASDLEPTNKERGASPDSIVPIEQLVPNPDQPRRTFEPDNLNDLANSIREKGVIQPLIVRPSPDGSSTYQIVAGERRWRAAQMAQLHELPVLIRNYQDDEVLEVAIIENIQRSDLNPVEEAMGFRQLIERYDQTQEQVAKVLGKSRSHVANQVRMLSLPDTVLKLVADGALTTGHARTLIGIDDPLSAAKKIIAQNLSVRQAEDMAKSNKPSRKRSMSKTPASTKDADTRQLEAELSATLKMKVSIDPDQNGEGGRLSIRYGDLGQLDDLLRFLVGD